MHTEPKPSPETEHGYYTHIPRTADTPLTRPSDDVAPYRDPVDPPIVRTEYPRYSTVERTTQTTTPEPFEPHAQPPSSKSPDTQLDMSTAPSDSQSSTARHPHRNPDAVREALRLRKCPLRPAEEIHAALGAAVKAETTHPGAIEALSAEQKPEIYARFADYIDAPLAVLHETKDDTGVPQLYWDMSGTIPVEPGQIETWNDLMDAFSATLDMHVIDFAESGATTDERASLEALWEVRQAGGSQRAAQYDALTHLRGGIQTAVTTMTTTAFGINKFLMDEGVPPEERTAILRRSTSPIMQLTETRAGQTDRLLIEQHGITIDAHDANEVLIGTDYDKISTTQYTLAPSGAVVLRQHPADHVLADGTKVSDTPYLFTGEVIACPIRLSPQQLQKLWHTYIDTAASCGLI